MGKRWMGRPLRRYRGYWSARVWITVAGLVVLAGTTPAWGKITSQATTSREAREAAVEAIPFDQLTPTTQQKLTDVISHASMYRRMPVKVIQCDPDLYVFLVRYPEVVVNIWRRMNITQVSTRRTGDFSLSASDGAGMLSDVELVYGTRDKHVLYATATYDGPLTRRPLKARCVLLLQSGYMQSPEGRTYVASQLDAFIRFDHVGADLAVRALHPLLGGTADFNFTESVGFLQQISQSAETNTYGVRRLAAQLTEIDPEIRRYFALLAEQASQKMAQRVSTPPTAPGPDRYESPPSVAVQAGAESQSR